MPSILSFLKYLPFAFTLFICSINAHSIVFVHIGSEIPSHLVTTLTQARLFNEQCSIFLIANELAIKNTTAQLQDNNITFIPCESLIPSPIHARFKNHPEHDMRAFGLWRYSSERFFYLEEFIRQFNLSDVFHLESDVMLYTDLENLLPVFTKYYKGMIGAIFEHDSRCVPSFLYISDINPIQKLIGFFPEYGKADQSDMEVLGVFKNQYHRVLIDYLPIVVPEYALDHPIKAKSQKNLSKEPECYSNHIDNFSVIFDGAALGIYVAGLDSRFHASRAKPGTISDQNIFNPSFFDILWEIDSKGRKIPTITYKGRKLPVVNLHITNKSVIEKFYSLYIE